MPKVQRSPASATLAALALLAVLPVPSGSAQLGGASKAPRVETRHLTMSPAASAPTVEPGGRLELFVDVAPKEKMHVYAPEQQDYIPIRLTVPPDRRFRTLPARYPRPEKYFFEPLNETQRVYSKPFRIVQPIAIARAAPAGDLTIPATVRYQACDDTICYLPVEVTVSWTVSVAASRTGR